MAYDPTQSGPPQGSPPGYSPPQMPPPGAYPGYNAPAPLPTSGQSWGFSFWQRLGMTGQAAFSAGAATAILFFLPFWFTIADIDAVSNVFDFVFLFSDIYSLSFI